MKVSYAWIRQYVDLPKDLDMEKLSYDLTMRTVEVESTKNLAEDYENIVVTKIKEVAPHPDADRLRLVLADLGQGQEVQVVCGGSNLYPGHLVVLAKPGSYARWHGEGERVQIEETSIRGQASYGMIVAASEIGLSPLFPAKEEREIVDLTAWGLEEELSLYPGQSLADALGLDDIIIEIENKSITNRPDLWSHYGLARELAVIYGKSLKPSPEFHPKDLPVYPLDIQAPDLCRRFLAGRYTGVDSRKSPFWMQLALMKADIRPINALVDITNYVMLAYGNPTHAYDADHLKGVVTARRAQEEEKLELLDHKELTLSSENLVIADQEKALGLAGIMGGAQDSILEETKEVVLEAANFKPENIRKTAQHFGLRTEASSRNEKGIDSQRIDPAFALANQLITQIFPQAKLVAFNDVISKKTQRAEVSLTIDWLSKRLGRKVSLEEVRALTEKLGFSIREGGQAGDLVFLAPTWRSTGDISLPDDILEEVARMIGYENFQVTKPEILIDHAINQKKKTLDRRIREYLAFSAGFQEITSYPWVKDSYLRLLDLEEDSLLRLAQPPAPDQSVLRPTNIPNLLEAVVNNVRYFDAFGIFECAQVYAPGAYSPSTPEEVLPKQEKRLAAALVGGDPAQLFYRMKGVLEEMGAACQTDAFTFGQEEKPVWADKEGWLNIYVGDLLVGSMGLLSNKSKYTIDLKYQDACLFEIQLDLLKPFDSRTNVFEPLPFFPHVFQDLSLLVKEETTWTQLVQAVGDLAETMDFVDEYRGSQIPEGWKSLTVRLELAAQDKTLTNEEIKEKMAEIQEVLEAAGASLREE